MPKFIVCNRTSVKSSRIHIDTDVESVFDLKERIAELIHSQSNELDLLYCGILLKDSKTLESYNIQAGVCIHALKRPEPVIPVEKPAPLDHMSTHQIVTALQTTLFNPAYRNTVEKMLEDPEAMENIMAATPGLESDPVALAILQDPMMLAMLADPKYIKNVIEAHPCLGQAALLVAASVTEEGTKSGSTPSSSRRTYSLDDMSDDEDYMPRGSGGASGSSAITSSQLAQALASTSTSSTPQSAQGATSGSESGITSDFFQQAINAALGGSPASSQRTPGDGSTAPPSQDLESQLQQLKDMGITDEDVARQALTATGGNLAAALELLFADDSII